MHPCTSRGTAFLSGVRIHSLLPLVAIALDIAYWNGVSASPACQLWSSTRSAALLIARRRLILADVRAVDHRGKLSTHSLAKIPDIEFVVRNSPLKDT